MGGIVDHNKAMLWTNVAIIINYFQCCGYIINREYNATRLLGFRHNTEGENKPHTIINTTKFQVTRLE